MPVQRGEAGNERTGITVATHSTARQIRCMRTVLTILLLVSVAAPAFGQQPSMAAQAAQKPAWWADADFWRIAAPFFGAFVGFFGATFVNDWLHRRRADRERRASAVGLAVALKGEALAAADAYMRTIKNLKPIMHAWAFGPPEGLTSESKIKITLVPEVTSRIFINNISRIELLGEPELIANITQFYSATSREYLIEEVQGHQVYAACEHAMKVAELAQARAEKIAADLQDCADRTK